MGFHTIFPLTPIFIYPTMSLFICEFYLFSKVVANFVYFQGFKDSLFWECLLQGDQHYHSFNQKMIGLPLCWIINFGLLHCFILRNIFMYIYVFVEYSHFDKDICRIFSIRCVVRPSNIWSPNSFHLPRFYCLWPNVSHYKP